MKSAQQQGYYKKIDFLPIREYDKKKADKAIAEKAVARLKADLKNGHNHILMARCSTKARAEEVYQYYEQYVDYNPVVVYSQVANSSAIIKDIKELKHKIIVCVNMLGEGFDLPQMKIAAVHDERQSLPITLQFIGRFTRTSADDDLGNASLIVNLANPPIADELRDLYSKDSDWNILLPQISDQATQEEVNFNQMLAEFNHLDNSVIPFHEIEPALSTQNEGHRKVERNIAFYNLDMIISIGYRVKSHRGVQFRIWATNVLREYIVKGFAMNDELLKRAGGGNYFDELLARIRDIRSSEKVF